MILRAVSGVQIWCRLSEDYFAYIFVYKVGDFLPVRALLQHLQDSLNADLSALAFHRDKAFGTSIHICLYTSLPS